MDHFSDVITMKECQEISRSRDERNNIIWVDKVMSHVYVPPQLHTNLWLSIALNKTDYGVQQNPAQPVERRIVPLLGVPAHMGLLFYGPPNPPTTGEGDSPSRTRQNGMLFVTDSYLPSVSIR